jgi:uncharacterized protein (TIRG00374 family)
VTSPQPSGRSRLWQATLGVIISVGLLYWSLKGVDFAKVIANVRDARPLPILLGVFLATLTFPVRLVRWRLLLRADDGKAYGWTPLWHALAMGFMANNILPLRAGEVVRTFAASRLTRAPFTAALSSVAVERVFDGLTLGLLLTIALLVPGLPAGAGAGSVANKAKIFGVLGLLALLAGMFVVLWPKQAEAFVRRLIPSQKLADRLVGIIEGLRQGLLVLQSPSRLAGVIFWSAAVWLVNALSFYVFFAAFGIPVNFAGALLLQSILAFGVAVPSTPGYVGVFEAAAFAALSLYGIPKDNIISYALTYHITTFIPITLLGLWSVVRTNLGLRQLRQTAA